ncbi:hypothetical protein M422DRAFT_70418 [Sphaerobolus stellatus SS14]|uniref:BZIP domain-containing protein n=1 Tax=Sphaerobolus stellatus (strain SS14) TaxID=990650 RepID=A0A0C9TSA5_SPHS4|nr:hypothetical protein M422DRAFT_70418 [Sphaerobolus stellatus SS14]
MSQSRTDALEVIYEDDDEGAVSSDAPDDDDEEEPDAGTSLTGHPDHLHAEPRKRASQRGADIVRRRSNRDVVAALKRENEKLRAHVAGLAREVDSVDAEMARWRAKCRKVEDERDVLRRELDRVNNMQYGANARPQSMFSYSTQFETDSSVGHGDVQRISPTNLNTPISPPGSKPLPFAPHYNSPLIPVHRGRLAHQDPTHAPSRQDTGSHYPNALVPGLSNGGMSSRFTGGVSPDGKLSPPLAPGSMSSSSTITPSRTPIQPIQPPQRKGTGDSMSSAGLSRSGSTSSSLSLTGSFASSATSLSRTSSVSSSSNGYTQASSTKILESVRRASSLADALSKAAYFHDGKPLEPLAEGRAQGVTGDAPTPKGGSPAADNSLSRPRSVLHPSAASGSHSASSPPSNDTSDIRAVRFEMPRDGNEDGHQTQVRKDLQQPWQGDAPSRIPGPPASSTGRPTSAHSTSSTSSGQVSTVTHAAAPLFLSNVRSVDQPSKVAAQPSSNSNANEDAHGQGQESTLYSPGPFANSNLSYSQTPTTNTNNTALPQNATSSSASFATAPPSNGNAFSSHATGALSLSINTGNTRNTGNIGKDISSIPTFVPSGSVRHAQPQQSQVQPQQQQLQTQSQSQTQSREQQQTQQTQQQQQPQQQPFSPIAPPFIPTMSSSLQREREREGQGQGGSASAQSSFTGGSGGTQSQGGSFTSASGAAQSQGGSFLSASGAAQSQGGSFTSVSGAAQSQSQTGFTGAPGSASAAPGGVAGVTPRTTYSAIVGGGSGSAGNTHAGNANVGNTGNTHIGNGNGSGNVGSGPFSPIATDSFGLTAANAAPTPSFGIGSGIASRAFSPQSQSASRAFSPALAQSPPSMGMMAEHSTYPASASRGDANPTYVPTSASRAFSPALVHSSPTFFPQQQQQQQAQSQPFQQGQSPRAQASQSLFHQPQPQSSFQQQSQQSPHSHSSQSPFQQSQSQPQQPKSPFHQSPQPSFLQHQHQSQSQSQAQSPHSHPRSPFQSQPHPQSSHSHPQSQPIPIIQDPDYGPVIVHGPLPPRHHSSPHSNPHHSPHAHSSHGYAGGGGGGGGSANMAGVGTVHMRRKREPASVPPRHMGLSASHSGGAGERGGDNGVGGGWGMRAGSVASGLMRGVEFPEEGGGGLDLRLPVDLDLDLWIWTWVWI